MSALGRGCVKTQNGTYSQNIGLPKRAVFDYFWLGIGRKTPEFEIELSFYTASANSRHSRQLTNRGLAFRNSHHQERVPDGAPPLQASTTIS